MSETIASQGWPQDTTPTQGINFVRELALTEGGELKPLPFIRTRTKNEARAFGRYWRDGKPVYAYVQTPPIPAGEEIVVFGVPNEQGQGDCLIDAHEGFFLKCADLQMR